jgi:hypothetical protein
MPRNRHLGREEHSGGPEQRRSRSQDGRAKSIAMSPYKPDATKQLSERECRDCEWASGARRRRTAAGFRMPLAEPGVRLSIRTGLSLDVHA